MRGHKATKVPASPRAEVNGGSTRIPLKWAVFPQFPPRPLPQSDEQRAEIVSVADFSLLSLCSSHLQP